MAEIHIMRNRTHWNSFAQTQLYPLATCRQFSIRRAFQIAMDLEFPADWDDEGVHGEAGVYGTQDEALRPDKEMQRPRTA